MRYSVFPTDSGYQNWMNLRAQRKDLRVYLNGLEVKDAVTVDTALGKVERWQRDSNGEVIMCDGEDMTITESGTVTVEEFEF